jgi:cobalt-zinc-cadmium efflux system outer membrane protein
MKFPRTLALPAALLGLTALSATENPPAAPLTLPEVLAEVRARHPALQAIRHAADAAGERAAVEGAWEDPRAAFRFERDGTRRLSTYSMAELEISQSLPFSGRNRARAGVARAEAGEMLAELPVREVELLGLASAAYYELSTNEDEFDTLERNRELLAGIRDNLKQRFEANRSPLSDLLAVETELALLRERRLEIAGRRDAARARLNALMRRPHDAPVGRAQTPVLPKKVPALAHFLAETRARNPLLAQAARRLATAESRAAVARLNTRPDPEIMVAVRKRNGSSRLITEYDTGVALSLPWANPRRNRAERAAANRGIEAAQHGQSAVEQEVLGRVASLWHALAAFRDCCSLYRDTVLPLARQGVEAAQRSFAAGQIPLSEVLDAQRRLLEAETGYIERQREFLDSLVSLGTATGNLDTLFP